jgi:hypothetical protein
MYERVNPSASKTTGGGVLTTPTATLDDGDPVVAQNLASVL